jgi:hypothetical protein
MASIGIFKTHHNWEDWLGMLLGVLIGISPWLAGQQDSIVVMWNAVLVGALVIALAELELVALQRWEEIGEMLCGLWLIVSPFALGYAAAGDLRFWHFGLGAVVVLLGAIELWQDWKLSERDLARHGQ